jgi:CTP:molybdopterin cytidylyltransferase MocA
MGMPKALVRDVAGTPWLTRSVQVLRDGGCREVVVVLGAGADEAEPLLAGLADVSAVRSEDWSSGMGASLSTGLAALDSADTDAALVHLVDLPDVTAAVVTRVLSAAANGTAALARASYDGRPGHPVLIGRDHWAGVITSATGDQGARAYLAAHDVTLVECGDLATGADVDRR